VKVLIYKINRRILIKFGGMLSDKSYLKLYYRLETGCKLDLIKPRSFNEKLQWLKLNYVNAEYTEMVDKFAVRDYIKRKFSTNPENEPKLIPLLGVYNEFDEIEFDTLPNQFVIKTTHDSGGVVICNDKSNFNMKLARKRINRSLNRNYFWHGREYPYRYIKPKVIIEKYMVDESGVELKDYKVFTFNGRAKAIQVDFDRFSKHKRNVYSTDWELFEGSIEFPSDPSRLIERPKALSRMLDISEYISEKSPHMRTDFYIIDGLVYFGEITFFHGNGIEKFTPNEMGKMFGDWLILPMPNR
jgi:hypothetical protein